MHRKREIYTKYTVMGKALDNRNAQVNMGKQEISIDQIAESIAGSKIYWPIFENINSKP